MAPVVNSRAALDHATNISQHTLAFVESIVLRDDARVRYQSCNGFILHVLNGRVYVAVHKSKLDRRKTKRDFISVRFQNNLQVDATIRVTYLEFYILETIVAGNFDSVNIGNMPRERTNVLILAQAKMEDELQFSAYSSSVIIPRNEFLSGGVLTPMDFQNPNFFSIGFTANMEIGCIMGAPIFDLDGIFLGIIHSYLGDMVFVRSSHFIPEIRTQIEVMNQI